MLHTAIVRLIEPVFAPSFSSDDYACRAGYGAHRAVLRLSEHLRRFRHVLHLDLKNYFPSIDARILRDILSRRLRDDRFLHVLDLLFGSSRQLYSDPVARRLSGLDPCWPPAGRGIPIGSFTSQLFAAHIYLYEFDHFVKRELKIPAYCRYVDDLFAFAHRSSDLERWRTAIAEWLTTHRGLRLKHPLAPVLSCRSPLHALGYRITRDGLRVRRRALQRLGGRAARHLQGGPSAEFDRSLASTAGLCLF